MYLQKLLSLASLVLFASAQNSSVPEPPAPGLTFLYTAYAECENSLYESQGPRGIRKAIPIIGGNFTGPRLRGEILNLGADWGLTDVQTGIFSADTRYNFRTHDGANILLQTSGPAQPGGGLQLRVLFETGDKDYYWLNNVVAVGLLSSVEDKSERKPGESYFLKIDVWHLTTENDQTKFINGSMEAL